MRFSCFNLYLHFYSTFIEVLILFINKGILIYNLLVMYLYIIFLFEGSKFIVYEVFLTPSVNMVEIDAF